jgi:hypothetical protein
LKNCTSGFTLKVLDDIPREKNCTPQRWLPTAGISKRQVSPSALRAC